MEEKEGKRRLEDTKVLRVKVSVPWCLDESVDLPLTQNLDQVTNLSLSLFPH